ncbi:MAG: hypothetical protein ACI4HO_00415 [Ruminococcus sp.]
MGRDVKFHLLFDNYEKGIILRSLNDEKNMQQKLGVTTDGIDDLILKVAYAPQKHYKVVSRNEAR